MLGVGEFFLQKRATDFIVNSFVYEKQIMFVGWFDFTSSFFHKKMILLSLLLIKLSSVIYSWSNKENNIKMCCLAYLQNTYFIMTGFLACSFMY